MIKFDNTLGENFSKGFWKILKEKRFNTRAVVSVQGKEGRSKNLDSASMCVIPDWRNFFSKLKNCEEKLVRDLSNQFGPNQEVCA